MFIGGLRAIHSPNASSRRGADPVALVIHYTATSLDAIEQARRFQRSKRVRRSAHFVTDKEGTTIQCVSTDMSAWHCGGSKLPSPSVVDDGWTGRHIRASSNQHSVGWELCNMGYGESNSRTVERHRNPACRATSWDTFPFAQIEAIQEAVPEIVAACPTLRYVIGHEDIANSHIPTNKIKVDPGPAFPWELIDWGPLVRVHFAYRRVGQGWLAFPKEEFDPTEWNGPGTLPRSVDPGP